MSSYARYCRNQAAECARRARLAPSQEIASNCLKLELRWIRLAEKAEGTEPPSGGSRLSSIMAALASALKVATPSRTIAVRHDPTDDRPYAAMDARTGSVLLRHQDSARLRVMCQRLGWRVVDDSSCEPPLVRDVRRPYLCDDEAIGRSSAKRRNSTELLHQRDSGAVKLANALPKLPAALIRIFYLAKT